MQSPNTPPTEAPPTVGHETKDVSIRGILWLAAATAAVIIAAYLLTGGLMGYLQTVAEREDPQLSPLAEKQTEPPAPRLQNTPIADFQHFNKSQKDRLESYGWVDKQQGVVRIPVSQAMDLILERGLPAPTGEPETPGEADRNAPGESTPKNDPPLTKEKGPEQK